MSEIVMKTKNGELIPAISPEAFSLAVQSMEELDQQMAELEVKAKALPKKFETKAEYDMGANLVAQKKSLVKLSESTMIPFTEILKRVKAFVDQQKNIIKNHGEVVGSIIEPAMIEWDERETRAAAAEEKRQQEMKEAQLKRENEEKAQKDAEAAEERRKARIAHIRADYKAGKITKRMCEKFLKEAGADEEAEKMRIIADKEDADKEAVEAAAKLKVKPNTGPTAGIVRRTNYTAVCIDEDLLLHRVVGEYIANNSKFGPLRDFVTANNQKIGEKAREIQDDKKMEQLYPFARASHTKTF